MDILKKHASLTELQTVVDPSLGVCKGGYGNPKSKLQTAWNPKSNFKQNQTQNLNFKMSNPEFRFQYPKSKFQRPEKVLTKCGKLGSPAQIQISNDKNPKSKIAFHPHISDYLLH